MIINHTPSTLSKRQNIEGTVGIRARNMQLSDSIVVSISTQPHHSYSYAFHMYGPIVLWALLTYGGVYG